MPKKSVSGELSRMIDMLVTGFVTVTELPGKILEKASKEGFGKEIIIEIIVTKLRERGLSYRIIRDKMSKELRLKAYPATRKKANQDTTILQISANSVPEVQLTTSVESNERTGDIFQPPPSIQREFDKLEKALKTDLLYATSYRICFKRRGTFTQIENLLFERANYYCDTNQLYGDSRE